MSDYSKLKVTELKEELKNRNIPLTKLKVKQDFIDKLLEADAADKASKSPATIAAPSDEAASAPTVAAQNEEAAAVKSEKAGLSQKDDSVKSPVAEESVPNSRKQGAAILAEKGDEPKENDLVGERAQASPARDTIDITDTTEEPTTAPTDNEDRVIDSQVQETAAPVDAPKLPSVSAVDQPSSHSNPERVNTAVPTPTHPSLDSTPSSGPVPSAELLEDSRKRKRRSGTPPPSTIEIAQKRAKASDGSPRAIQKEESVLVESSQPPEDINVTINGHELQEKAVEHSSKPEGGAPSASGVENADSQQKLSSLPRSHPPVLQVPSQQDGQRAPPIQDENDSPSKSPVHAKARSPNLPRRRSPSPPNALPSEDRLVSPALHAATSSLYIRNFKRPLHIPSLRSHLSALAASPNRKNDTDPITSFYLDSVRTHGFVSFSSITAASRARSALHDSRFPDEKTREPLWVDFVPDEKVEEWIETEQKANGGGRIGRRWEVAYLDSQDGIEAILQEAGSGSGNRLAPVRAPSAPMGRRESEMAGTTSNIPGVHPDRARLVPAEDNLPPRKDSILQQESRAEQTGTGFRALDDLFPSTTAKPKLYYKAVAADMAEERLDMIRDLRKLGGAKSGDPDMKRYSFEVDRGREEWVDKGPEFGFGARGRAVERGGRGGYRGRGGGFGRGSDTWRSGPRH
jgi:hypothetical protein